MRQDLFLEFVRDAIESAVSVVWLNSVRFEVFLAYFGVVLPFSNPSYTPFLRERKI